MKKVKNSWCRFFRPRRGAAGVRRGVGLALVVGLSPGVGRAAPDAFPGSSEGAPAALSGASEARPTVSATPGKGVTVTTADDRFAFTARARMQLRNTFQHDNTDASNEVHVRTLRLVFSGHVLAPELKYTIQLALGGNDFDKDPSTGTNPSPIFDAFVEYVKLRDLNVRVGQYFVPFDRARTIREFALQMVDRQLVVRELTLDRDVGLMLSSSDLFGWQGKLGYHLFVGGGEGRNRFGPQKLGPLLIARLVTRPMGPFDDDQEGDLSRSASPRLAVGIAGGYNHRTNRSQSTFGTTLAGTFDYVHAAADLVFKWHGFSLLTEGVYREANQDQQAVVVDGEPAVEYSRSGYGYFVQGGHMLTDKLELTARWDELYAKQGTDPKLVELAQQQGRQAGAGLNVYLNGHAFKFQTDYFAIFGQKNTDNLRHAWRVQLDATF